jgi:carbon-monoxide dehydrogenase large subunit
MVNAVADALRDYGVTDLDMPLTPGRVWQTMRGGRAA